MDRLNPWNSGEKPGSQIKSGDTSRNLNIPDFAPPLDDAEGIPGQVYDNCPCCTAQLDVTGISPLSVIGCPSCRQEFRVLEQYAGFTLAEQIGMGPSGTVYLARNPPSDQPIALKMFWPELGAQPEHRDRVIGAARTLSGFSHPHIVRAFSANVDNGLLYVAMEHVGGGSLAQTIAKRGRVPELEALTLASQIIEALQAAANHGLDHGDLKPSNILYTPQGNVKVSDFGQSTPTDFATSAPANTAQLPFYAAPEKLAQQAEDLRSDFYSLGAILFHLLTGRPPFPGQNAELVIQKHLEHRAPSVQAFMPEISGAAASMIAKMLEKAPLRRHQTCQELLEHLRGARAELGAGKPPASGVQAPSARRKPDSGPSPSRRAWLPLAAAGPAVLILAVGGWFILSQKHGAPSGDTAPPPVAATAPSEPAPTVEPTKTTDAPVEDAAEDAFALAMKDHAFATAVAAVGANAGDAAKQIDALVNNPGLDKTTLCWALAIQGTQRLAAGKVDEATPIFQKLSTSAKWVDAADLRISFGSLGEVASGSSLASSDFPSPEIRQLSYLTLGLKAWAQNDFDGSSLLLQEFAGADPSHPKYSLSPLANLAISRLPDASLRESIERGKKVRSMPDAFAIQHSLETYTGPLAAVAHAAAVRMAKARAEAQKDVANLSTISVYRIVNHASGLCLTGPDSEPTGAAAVVLKPFRPGNVAQCWRLPRLAYGQTALTNARFGTGVTTQNKDGDPVAELKNFEERDATQEFIVKKVDDRFFTFASENGGKLLTAKINANGEGEAVAAADRQTPKQEWEIIPVPEAVKWADQGGKFEIEWLETIDKSADEYRVVAQNVWSGSFGTILDAAAPGAFVTLRIPDVKAGTYEVRLGARIGNLRGKCQVSMGPEKGPLANVGPEQDLFLPEFLTTKELIIGSWTNPKNQNVAIKFTVTGKNAASKVYFLGLDYVKLAPAK